MPPNSFKSDESFLQKLAIGASGTQATMQRLEALGFQPIELERGSSGFKIWKKIKIKRVRVPDILCLKSGWRFESRGKTKPEISMSHSLSDPNRAWDSGMRGDDFVVVVVCEQATDSIVDWVQASPIHFIRVSDLQLSYSQGFAKTTTPKGVDEGSEIRIIWPSAVANGKSKVLDVDERWIKLSEIEGGHSQRCQVQRNNKRLHPQCEAGDVVERNQIVAAVVPVHLNISCPEDVGEDYFRDKLSSASLSERYAAAKALRFRGYRSSVRSLVEKLGDSSEDIYVRLEIAAALAAYNYNEGWFFLESCLASEFAQVQLETVIVLSEMRNDRSQSLLIGILSDTTRHEEIRAGASWALGEFHTDEAGRALAETFDQSSIDIKVEAARALLKIAPERIPLLVELIKSSSSARRDGLAWVLAKKGGFDPNEMLLSQVDDNLRRWIGYILGYGKNNFIEPVVESVCHADPEVYFSASVLWQLLASWIFELKEF